jgi:predicted rRNA methylase YqxC with S4 and FtsJ domains
LVQSGLAESGTDAQRKIKQREVYLDANLVVHPVFTVTALPFDAVIRVGRRLKKIVITA